jgi:hypothetical protein
MFVDEKWVGEVRTATEPWRTVLLESADYIERVGWCQRAELNENGQVCAIGGVFYSGEEGYRLEAIYKEVITKFGEYINAYCGGSNMYGGPLDVALWNDRGGRTKEEVVSAMRACANA